MSPTALAVEVFHAALERAKSAMAEAIASQVQELIGPVSVLALGKAAPFMARHTRAALGERFAEGLLITPYPLESAAEGFNQMVGGHPIPDTPSLAAGEAALDFARQAQGNLLVLLSGGASASAEALADGVNLNDLQELTNLLVKSGLGIREINVIRQAVSRLKGGGLLRATGAKKVMTLVMSDVEGNDFRTIGSAPCLYVPTDPRLLVEILDRAGVGTDLQTKVVAAAEARGHFEIPQVKHVVIGDADLMAEFVRRAAEGRNLRCERIPRFYAGDAADWGRDVALRLLAANGDSIVQVGEPTMRVTGNGKGGRAQHAALSAAIALRGTPDVAIFVAGTDGIDGPTDAAGAVVDGTTASDLTAATEALQVCNAYPFLNMRSALLRTGPTGINLNDVALALTKR